MLLQLWLELQQFDSQAQTEASCWGIEQQHSINVFKKKKKKRNKYLYLSINVLKEEKETSIFTLQSILVLSSQGN